MTQVGIQTPIVAVTALLTLLFIFPNKNDAGFFTKCQQQQQQQATQTRLNQCERRSQQQQQQQNGKNPKTPAPAELLHCHFLSSGSLKGTFHVALKVELNLSHKFLCQAMGTFTFSLHLNVSDSFTPKVRVKEVSATSDI